MRAQSDVDSVLFTLNVH